MDSKQLKQRIVGAIVLVALGVIFIPIILNKDDGISGSNIPEVPSELEELAERNVPALPPSPQKPEQTRQVVDEKTVKLGAEEKQKTATPVAEPVQKPLKTTTDKSANKKTRAWVVQVASFSERKKALALRDKLRKAGFNTFVESVSSKNSVLFRVRVGPVVRKTDAEIMQKKIARKFRLKDTLVMAHP